MGQETNHNILQDDDDEEEEDVIEDNGVLEDDDDEDEEEEKINEKEDIQKHHNWEHILDEVMEKGFYYDEEGNKQILPEELK